MGGLALVFAHGNGIDDAALTILPLGLFAALLFRAKRGAAREDAEFNAMAEKRDEIE